jgi:hypothetical protein
MISRTEAEEIAEKFIAEQGKAVEGGVTIIRQKTLEKPYGWIFFYNSRRYLETGNPLEALGGNGPVVVAHADGRVTALSSAAAPSASIAEFERLNELR